MATVEAVEAVEAAVRHHENNETRYVLFPFILVFQVQFDRILRPAFAPSLIYPLETQNVQLQVPTGLHC